MFVHHQTSALMAKMHQNPMGRAQHSPDDLAGFKGPISNEREERKGRESEVKGQGGERKEWDGR